MSRPAIHLTSWSRRDLHGPGPRICAMAAPRRWERGDGYCQFATPMRDHLRAVQAGRMSWAEYRAALDATLTSAAELGWLAPGRLGYVSAAGAEDDCQPRARPVPESATLLCACAAPGSLRRVHPCHLEVVAPYLVAAGWDVVLWGRRITATVGRDGAPSLGMLVYADGSAAYDPAAYGWPESLT